MINPMELTGKHIIITGASSGIGRQTCIQASKLGARISLIARNEERLAETISLMDGTGHKSYSYDLNNTGEIDALIQTIVNENSPIDGLVHCAGLGINRPLKLLKPDFLQNILAGHLFAFVEIVRACSAKKRANENASFVGISSVAAFHGNKTQGAYSAAKAAMNAVVHPFAKELAPKKIRINTIAFGMVETDMYKGFLESGGNNEELLNDQYLGIIPREYAANAICFLLSDMSKYMTGGTLCYDAGDLS